MARSVITEQTKQRMAELHAAGKGRNDIAAELGISAGSVTNIARQIGLAFDRAAPLAAIAARQIDLRARRSEILVRLYDRASEFIEQMDQPHLVFSFGGKDNDYNERTLDRPPTGDIRNLMQSASIALQRAVDMEKVDASSGTDDAKSMLGAIANSLKAVAEQIP